MSRTKLLLVASALAFSISACQQAGTGTEQSAAAQGTELGIVPASMDRSVKPGDDFFAFANGSWVKNTPIPEDRSSIGGFYIADQERERQTTRAARRNPRSRTRRRTATKARSPITTTPISTPTRSTEPAWRPPRPISTRSAASPTRRQLSAAIGGTLRADTDPLNATNFQTENLFGIFVTQGLNTPGETLPYLMQGGIGLPEREYYLSGDAKMAGLRDKYRAYIATIMKAAGNRRPAGRRQPHPRPRDQDRPRPCHARGERGLRQGRDRCGRRAELEQKAPGIDWAALLDAAQLGGAQKFQAYHARRHPEARRAGRLGAARRVEGLAGVPHAQPAGERAAQAVPRRQLRLQRHGARRNAASSGRATSSRSTRSATRSRTRSARPMSTNISRPRPRPRSRSMVDEIKAAFARRVEAIDWMAPSTKEEALKKVRRSSSASAIPTRGATIPRSRSRRRRLCQPEECRARRISPPDREDRQADGPQRMVDAAAAGQRGQPAGAERAQLPGRDPPAALLRSRRPTRRSTMARSARSSATRSATASTITAPCSIRPGACATGGLRPTSSASSRRATRSPRNTTTYEALPGLHVNGKLTLGENIADVAGLAAAYDAYRHSLGGKEAPVIDGFTGDQRFFIAYAPGLGDQDARGDAAPAGPHRRPRAGPVPGADRCATSTPGTRRSTSSRARSCIWRPRSA